MMGGDIGDFEIGVSAIGLAVNPTGPDYPPAPSQTAPSYGDIVPFDYWQTIISQYANSPILTELIGNYSACLDQTANINAFYNLIMNVVTAEDYGLDVWGRIVGVTRTMHVANATWFGFGQAVPGVVGFGQAPFYSGEQLTTNYQLGDNSFRTLIFAKAMANISDGSIKSINQILMALFPNRGNCYVADVAVSGHYFGFNENPACLGFGQAVFYSGEAINAMKMAYTFQFPLTNIELAIVEQSGVLPKPCGVAASIVIV